MEGEISRLDQRGQDADFAQLANRPSTVQELIEMAEHNPEQVCYFFSDDEIRALIPANPNLAEKIILASRRSIEIGGPNAA